MAWSNPTTRATGYLVTAAVWNQDVVDNPQFLHDRLLRLYAGHQHGTTYGDYSGQALGTTGSKKLSFTKIPDDFSSIDAAGIIILNGNTTSTLTFNITTDYAQVDGTEISSTHSESISNININPFTLGYAYESDISAALTSVAAGDAIGVAAAYVSGGNTAVIVGAYIDVVRT